MSLQSLADELGVDVADVRAAVATWTDADPATAEDSRLEHELRVILDPLQERGQREQACRGCGRWPKPYRFLIGWHPCLCGGHQTRFCRADTGGCGHTHYDPPINPDRCIEPGFGFSASGPK